MKKVLFSLLTLFCFLSAVLFAGAETTPTTFPMIDPNAMENWDTTPTPMPAEPTPTPRPNVVLPGWASLSIAADTTAAEVTLPNPKANAELYYLSFELFAALPEEDVAEGTEVKLFNIKNKESGTTEQVPYAKLYASGLVPPGMAITKFEMTQTVPAGSYPAIVSLHPYYFEDYMPTPNIGHVAITLHVIDSSVTLTTTPEAIPAVTPAPPPVGF